MATLEKIRNKAGLLVVVIGVALFAFIIGDFLNSSQTFFAMKEGNIITINDEKINVEEFQSYADRMRNSGMASDENAYEVAYEQIINEYVLNQEFDMLGITVSDKELQDLLVGENIHPIIIQQYSNPQTGFNKEEYLNYVDMIHNPEANGITDPNDLYYIEQYRAQWVNMENFIRDYRKIEKLAQLLDKATTPNKLDAEMAYEESSVASNIQYVKLPYSTIADATIEVTEEEINGKYDAYKNNYPVEESRMLSYIQVDLRPSLEDRQAVETEINSFREEFATTDNVREFINMKSDHEYVGTYKSVEKLDASLREFVDNAKVGDISETQLIGEQYVMHRLMGVKTAPDTVKANMVLFAYGDTTINDVYAQLQEGVSFDSIKAQYPVLEEFPVVEDQLLISDGQAQINLGAAFINDIYNAKNDYFTTNMLDGTQCIVKVVERTANVKKVDVATFALDVITSDETILNAEAKLHEYITANKTSEDFVNNALSANYIVKRNNCTLNQSNLANIAGTRAIVRWAYNSSLGAVSEVHNISDKYLIAAAITEVTPRGVAAISAQDKAYITRQLTNEKKAEAIKNNIAGVKYTTLDELAAAMDVTVETRSNVAIGDNFTNMALAGAVSRLEEGAISEPIVANDGVYVVQVVSKVKSEEPYNEEFMMRSLYKLVDFNAVQKSLRDNAEITTTYTKFF